VLLMFIYYPRSFRGFVFGEVRVAHVYILPQVFGGFVFGEVRVTHVYILPQVF
jgi:hypothetical protein